ncbi:tryptophan 7-halogenase [Thalassotalea sp. M1531]|uniref:Tryptophan 7-halogenase n=1 Tax=Thalassotalea algicola TaxID=2716224 RepID=A0A7Y0L9K1_9GAMM|nr:tryptophan halogenase family protein [Thalassotalea algicola]NMP30277.1 tryptophan 7-halogenase [Thalassotalea algicola]
MATHTPIKQVIIVGGGTAGWLAANHLGKNLAPSSPDGVKVTLIESPDIPTIGVGEGTVPLMRQSLKALGISETEFIRECDVTFKQGIKFVDWLHNPIANNPHYYHHIFDYPQIEPVDLTPFWLDNNQGRSYVDTIAWQGKVCDAGLAPKLITSPEYQGQSAYAYHLDAGKFSALLTKNAVERFGVNHILANVVEVKQHENGDIASVVTDRNGELSADLFIDCTGFSAKLIGDVLNVPFIDKSDVLFADHAVVMQVPYQSEDQAIASHTISTAQQSGWIWDIGLQTRKGVGHVYSSNHTSHEQAEHALRTYIGKQAESIGSRVIKMNIGYREKFWHNNCVALGLSQGFVEPLEATGLLVFDATAKMLAEQFPTTTTEIPLIAKLFNQRMSESWEKVIDFIKLHYCISKRDDSQFWLDNRELSSIPDSLQERLARWKFQPPSKYDFFSGFEIFNLENYLYVLYGMEYPTASSLVRGKVVQAAQIEELHRWIANNTEQALTRLPKHRELIEKIKQFGLQRV